jgi:hypothetical protein
VQKLRECLIAPPPTPSSAGTASSRESALDGTLDRAGDALNRARN